MKRVQVYDLATTSYYLHIMQMKKKTIRPRTMCLNLTDREPEGERVGERDSETEIALI